MAPAGPTRLAVVLAAGLSLGFGGVRLTTHRQSFATSQLARPGSPGNRRGAIREDCEELKPPSGSKLAAHYYATGVQIYRWTGSAWTLVGPDAVLFADPGHMRKAGTHYAGPTWQSVGGSKVVGSAAKRCTPDSTALPWLSLDAISNDGFGVFRRVTSIQRMHTAGGVAPSVRGTTVGEEVRVRYRAEYLFYRTD